MKLSKIPNYTGQVGQDFTIQLDYALPPETAFTLTAKGLPDGLTLERSGRISGVLTAAGKFSPTITLKTAQAEAEEQSFIFQVTEVPVAKPAATTPPAKPAATS